MPIWYEIGKGIYLMSSIFNKGTVQFILPTTCVNMINHDLNVGHSYKHETICTAFTM